MNRLHIVTVALAALLVSTVPAAAQTNVCAAFPASQSMPFDAIKAPATLEWCVLLPAVDAMKTLTRLYVDAAALAPLPPQLLGGVQCTDVVALPMAQSSCRVLIPPQTMARLALPGAHTLELTLALTVDGKDETTASRPVGVSTPVAGCTWIDQTTNVATQVPVGTIRGERSTLATANFITRVFTLRHGGWRIDWQRVQWTADAGAGAAFVPGGFYILGADCVGLPQ